MKIETKTIILKRDTQKTTYIETVWKILLDGYKNVAGGLFL